MKQTRRSFLTQTIFGADVLYGASALVPASSLLLADDAAAWIPLYADGEYRRIDSQERVFHICC